MVFKFIYDIFFDKPIFSMYNSLCDTLASLAQLDRVVHYECKGLGFESLMTHHRKKTRLWVFFIMTLSGIKLGIQNTHLFSKLGFIYNKNFYYDFNNKLFLRSIS